MPANKRKILVIGLLDSVHLAKWLKQFSSENIEFLIMPSKKFRKIHPLLIRLVKNNQIARYKIKGSYGFIRIAGFVDYLQYEFFLKSLGARAKVVQRILDRNKFDFVHALEIQGAGYLLTELKPLSLSSTKVIVTNWGSDIYYFQKNHNHRLRIEKVLNLADFYSAECFRDYRLAKQLGFRGIDLPCIPNSGGISLCSDTNENSKTSSRKQIIVKGYGGTFGRIDLVLESLSRLISGFPSINVFIYSVTDDVRQSVEEFRVKFPLQVTYQTTRDQLSIGEMRIKMLLSRIYIGCSNSDGISTSFLEALTCGAFAIQSNTSCASEWLQKGFVAHTVDLDVENLTIAILNALQDDDLVDSAQVINSSLSKEYLDIEIVKRKALSFYSSK